MALWPWLEGVKSLSPGACRADQSSFLFCQPCPACPASLAENCARGSCLGKRMCHNKSPPENQEGRRMAEGNQRDSLSEWHCLHSQMWPFQTQKGRGPRSWQHDPRGSLQSPFPAGKLQVNPGSATPSYPTLSVQCPVQVSASICQELFLQVKLHISKEKSGNRTRRSIQTPHLIKHPIHNRLH